MSMKNVIKITAPNGDTLHMKQRYIYDLFYEAFIKDGLTKELAGKWRIEIE